MSVPLRFDQLDKSRQEKIRANLTTLESKGASDDEVESYLRDDEGLAPTAAPTVQPTPKPRAPFDLTKVRLGSMEAGLNAMQPKGMSPLTKVAAIAKGVPFGEAALTGAQTGLSKLGSNPLTYAEQYAKNQKDLEQLSEPMQNVGRLIGGYLTGRALPLAKTSTVGQAIKQGAKVGAGLSAADVVGTANPDISATERAIFAAPAALVGGALGGTIGGGAQAISKGGNMNRLRGRIKEAETGGKIAVETDEAIKQSGIKDYGEARAAGEVRGGTSPALRKELDRPEIKQYADEIRGDTEGRILDTDLSLDVYKGIQADIRGIDRSLKANYDPDKARTLRNLKRSAKRLRSAMDAVSETPPTTLPGHETITGPIPEGTAGRKMGEQAQVSLGPEGTAHVVSPRDVQGPAGPSFMLRGRPPEVVAPGRTIRPVMPEGPVAIGNKARQEHAREMFEEGRRRARIEMSDRELPERALKSVSPEANQKWIESLSPEDAAEARRGALAAGKGALKLPHITPGTTLFSQAARAVTGPTAKLNRLSPFVNALDARTGTPVKQPLDLQELLRALGIANAPLANK